MDLEKGEGLIYYVKYIVFLLYYNIWGVFFELE